VAGWTSEELDRIAAAEELEIAARRADGTLRPARTIWVVRAGDELYVRSWRGVESAWYRQARASGRGHIRAGGVSRDVGFAQPGDDVRPAIDRAYRTKYRRYGSGYVEPMVGPVAVSATLRLVAG
jgi:hypothetical protein